MSEHAIAARVYRVYLRDAADHIVRPVEITSSNDENALEQAEKLAGKYAVELWDRARKVGSFSGKF
jgi:hypothetical protein